MGGGFGCVDGSYSASPSLGCGAAQDWCHGYTLATSKLGVYIGFPDETVLTLPNDSNSILSMPLSSWAGRLPIAILHWLAFSSSALAAASLRNVPKQVQTHTCTRAFTST